MPSSLMVVYKGKVVGDEIIGNTVLFDKMEDAGIHKLYGKGINEGSGEWQEKMLASWHFNAVNPCDQVTKLLRKSIAFLEAFHDTTPLFKGVDIKTYLNEVDKLAAKIYGQSSGSSEQYVAFRDMGVDKNCNLVGEDTFKDGQMKSCSPEIITNAILTHEMTHLKQCNNSNALFIRGFKEPRLRRKFEIEAYCSEIEMLLNWLDKNCGNKLSKHKDKYNNICN